MNRPAPLYVRVMGDSWRRLAEPLRCLHATHSITRASGRLRVEHGTHYMARLVARLLRLPRPNASADTRLTLRARGEQEHWERAFDGRRVGTIQYESHDGELAERFGAIEFLFRLDTPEGGLLYVQREAFLCWPFRLRIPPTWAPRVQAREDPAGHTRIHVDVRVTLPGVGPLISYAGFMDVEAARP